MKHHLYQIYYGGFKTKLKDYFYCKDCDSILDNADTFNHKYIKNDK